MKFYAVTDTNVIVSALLAKHPDSAPVQVIEQVFDRVIVPMFNDEILSEYKEVLKRPKFLFAEREGLCSLRCAFPFCSPQGPCKQFEAHGITAFGLFQHKSLQEQAPDGLARKKPSALR